LLISLFISGIAVHFFKFLFGRLRPHRTEVGDPNVFVPFNFDWHYHSLPSGHSQVLFTVATCLALAFPKKAVVLYLSFFALAMTRVFTIQHFLSDVMMGCLLGYVVTQLIAKHRSGRSFTP
jgi:membrane-associated phospholipid phosphatase